MLRRLRNKLVIKLGKLLTQFEQQISAATLPEFGNRPNGLVIERPRRIVHPECFTLGDHIYLGPGSLLVAVTEYPGPENASRNPVPKVSFEPKIRIGSRVSSTGGLQVAACSEITIGDDVLFATNVNITDALHGYKNVDLPFKSQAMQRVKPIHIGNGCWIGQNTVILPGTHIGNSCIVGANSVVSGHIPDGSIVLGAPARIVKQWDESSQDWSEVSHGN